MILKEVTIQGFKSFADRTKIELGSGVTTIVGPNGCGKSNVVDAIRWVLGEQSAKALRGGKMHDVIFAGTDNRPQGAECQVSLLFTDCEQELGTAYNEVEITRRVTREGSSQYLLNGATCRLKDIQNLFMDTGIGRVSYSFMVQGQIDQILSNNPAERRIIFEEAAGITRYKTQRREALNKLNTVDQNLSRVSDVIDEVGRQMASLKRQASKAIRFQRIKHRLDHLDLAFHAYHFSEKQLSLHSLQEKASQLRDQAQQAAASMANDESDLEEQKSSRSEHFERLQEIQQNTYNLRSQKDQLDNQAQLAQTRKKDTADRISDLEQEVHNIEQSIKDLASKAEEDANSKQMQLDLLGSSDSTFQSQTQELQAIESELSSAENNLRDKKRKLIELDGEVSRLRAKTTQLEVTLKTDDAKVSDLTDKIQELESQQSTLQSQLQDLKDKIDDQQQALEAAESDVQTAQTLVETKTQEFRSAQEQKQDQDRQLARLNAQLSILENLQEKMEGFSDGAKAIMKGKLGEISDSTQLLTQGISLPKEYTPALEALLGQAINAVTIDDFGQASNFSRQLKEQDLGRACFALPITKPEKSQSSFPLFLKPASDLITIKNKTTEKHWKQLLSGCFFCDSLDPLIEYWEANPAFDFLFIATKDGELIDSRGFLFGGSTSNSNAASLIQRDSEIQDLRAQVESESAKLQTLSKQVESAQAALTEAEQDLSSKRAHKDEVKNQATTYNVEHSSVNNAFNSNLQNAQRAKEQLTKIQETHSQSESSLAQAQESLSLCSEQHESLKSTVASSEESIAQIRSKRDAKRDEVSDIRIELAEKKQKLNLIDQGLSELERRKQGLSHRKEQRSKESLRLKDYLVTLDNEINEAQAQAAQAQKSLEESNTHLESQRTALAKIEDAIKQMEDGLSSRRKSLHDVESNLKETEVALTKEQSEVNFLIEKAETDYNKNLSSIDYREMLWIADEEFETRIKIDDLEDGDDLVPKAKHERGSPTEQDLEALENSDWTDIQSEIKQLKGRVASMGAVNLVAIDEYASLKERFQFLNQQCDDLKTAKEQLLTAIDDINKTSQEMFTSTFEKVKEYFKYTFETLFGGGHAELNLQESDDPLDAGIEIIARPPGTKLRSLSLLSGGQKTMTAVALLFAIYRVKPSPFCVLDELDAPLDDANIGRFVKMLKQFTEFSQFLVISHNKRTISESDTLYGVTMQEKGVTKLLSMRFNSEPVRSEPIDDKKLEELVEA